MPSRFFNPAFSQQQVPSYAPLPLDAIQYGVQSAGQARQRADQTFDTFQLAQQEQLSSLVPQNRRQAAEILERDEEFIQKMADPESGVRYQDMPGLIRKHALKSQAELRPYLEDSAQIRSFQERAREMYDKGDLTLSYKQYMDRTLGDYEGLQFDEDGTPQGFRPPPLVRRVDINDKLDTFMKHLQDGNEQVFIDEYGADPRFVKQLTHRYRSEGDIAYVREALTQLLRNDPETQQYLEAEYMAEADLQMRRGQEPIEFDDFVNRMVNPYVAADAMPVFKETLRSNPGFSVEDLSNSPMTGSLLVGTRESNISTPGSFRTAIGELQEGYESIQEHVGNRLQKLGLDYDFDPETGLVVVSNPVVGGRDLSNEIHDMNRELNMAFDNVRNMEAYDQEVREKAELVDWGENEQMYEDELVAAYKAWNAPKGSVMWTKEDSQFVRDGEVNTQAAWEEFRKSEHYRRAMEKVSPEFKKYTELLHENAKAGHREVKATSLGNKADRFLEDYLVRFNPALEDGKTRQPLEDADRDFDIRTAQLAGVFSEPGEGLKVAYQVWSADPEDQDPRLILTNAPPEAQHFLFQAGNYTQFDAITYNLLSHLSEEPGGRTMAELPVTDADGEPIPGADITVRMLRRSEQNPHQQYEVVVPRADDTVTPIRVGTLQQVADIYRRFYAKVNE